VRSHHLLVYSPLDSEATFSAAQQRSRMPRRCLASTLFRSTLNLRGPVRQMHFVPNSSSHISPSLLCPGGQHSLWPPLMYTPPSVQQWSAPLRCGAFVHRLPGETVCFGKSRRNNMQQTVPHASSLGQHSPPVHTWPRGQRREALQVCASCIAAKGGGQRDGGGRELAWLAELSRRHMFWMHGARITRAVPVIYDACHTATL
jgi:hypothetical protein